MARATAADARRRFGPSVECHTAHSLAFARSGDAMARRPCLYLAVENAFWVDDFGLFGCVVHTPEEARQLVGIDDGATPLGWSA